VKHSKVRARLNDYLERDLPPSVRREVDAHLTECAACTSTLRELERTVGLLRRMPDPEPPPYLTQAVMARVAEGEATVWSPARFLQRLMQPALAMPLAGALVGLLAFASLQGGSGTGPTAEAPSAAAVVARTAPPPTDYGFRAGIAPESRLAAAERRGRYRERLMRPTLDPWAHNAMRSGRSQDVAQWLRGAGHPHSEMLAAHFDRADQAVFVTYTPR
jgi:hypothetical protein